MLTDSDKARGALDLSNSIESCCLPKLANDVDSEDPQNHYRLHANSLRGKIGALRRRLACTDLSQFSIQFRVEVVSSILVLLHELRLKGPWSPEGFENYATLIEEAFTQTNNVSLDRFAEDAGDFKQAILDAYLASIHKKLTAQDWKKFPATVMVYSTTLKQIEKYKGVVDLDPVKILPASLLLIDDFNKSYKQNGLEMCLNVLHNLTQENFKNSNYQQVIYEAIYKVIRDKDLQILKLAHKCLVQLLPMFKPASFGHQWNQFDTLLNDVIQDIYLETNIERKAVCFEFLSNIINIRQSECIRCKKKFNIIFCENLDLCSVEHARKTLLHNVILALKAWLKYCWIVWNYETDKKIISLLLKLMYVQCTEKVAKKKIDDLEAVTICIISLCAKEQKDAIINSLSRGDAIENNVYIERLKHIIKLVTESNNITKCKEKKKT